jgi:hypothetical protein
VHTPSISGGATAWYFVKNTDRIWIARPDDLTITVRGPRWSRTRYQFDDEHSVQDFQIALAERLAGEGWLLCPWQPPRARD